MKLEVGVAKYKKVSLSTLFSEKKFGLFEEEKSKFARMEELLEV